MGREEQVAPAKHLVTERRGSVLIALIDNPPAAALSSAVRSRLWDAISEVSEDAALCALVISGQGGAFATGAGVTETNDPSVPSLGMLCEAIEAMEKPVVVAVSGPALGGGLELALAAHYRLCLASARFGAPDITIGLVPNAGGTQRLPKVIGGVAALKLLLSGRAVTGEAAKKLGLVDKITGSDLLEVAVREAERLARTPETIQRSSSRRDRLGEGTAFLEAVASHRKAAEASPMDAPIRMIELVEAALLLPYDIGRGMEEAAFDDLLRSEHSKSLRHIFSAERRLQAATRWEGRVASRAMTGVTVIGARGIGAEVAVQCLDAGFNVTVAEVDEAALEDGVSRIIGHFDGRVLAGSMTEEAVEGLLDRMHALAGYDRVGEADIVIDPAALLTKARVAELDAAMKAGAVLLIGGELVDIGTVASMTGRTSDVVGMRFYPGVRKNRLIELAFTEATGPRAVATARSLARKMDRLIVETAPGKVSIGTRILEALHAAADLCLEDGARMTQIDAALKDWGLPFGSFGWRDLTGIKRISAPRGMEGQRGGGVDQALVASGRLGMSNGRGYYIYPGRNKPGQPDPEVQKMIDADRVAKEVKLRSSTDGEVRARCVAAMAGAGAHMLMEGIARRAEDIDMVAVHGLGFARRTGGVLYAADLMGLKQVLDLVQEMSDQTPRILPPADLLVELVEKNEHFIGQCRKS